MVVFISYAREDREAVAVLRRDIESSKRDTWMDEELEGGESWWGTILEQIRGCSAFVFVVSSDSLTSRACRAELDYALALRRPLLPVMVREVDFQQAVDAVADAQVVDYRQHTAEAAIALLTALSSLPLAPPLPSPPPPPPAAPIAHLGGIRQRLDAESLSHKEQWDILTELRERMSVQEDRASVSGLLQILRRRQDVTESVAAAIDALREVMTAPDSGEEKFVRWPSLLTFIKLGKLTPVLGLGLTDSLIGPRYLLARKWADEYSFPLARHQKDDLPQVAQYVRVENDEITLRTALGDYMRRQVVERFPTSVPADLGPGRLDDMIRTAWLEECAQQPSDPHTFLAQLPVSIYITAHPSNLLSTALRAAGRDPVIELCRWRADVDDWPPSPLKSDPNYEPTVDRPLVFHLFGNLDFPDSLVLTEDDYFDFLIGVSLNRSLIPPPVQRALADSALVFLGFRIEAWDFRVLLRCLLSQEGGHRRDRYKHVAAQLDVGTGVMSPERARAYLRDYFGQFRETSIDIFWGTVDQFVSALAAERSAA
jgi:TIR domain/SIR2-like domain